VTPQRCSAPLGKRLSLLVQEGFAMIALWIVLAIVVVIVVWLIAMYNGLITRKNRVEEASSDIDVQLKRRYELIPNLVNTVKGYAKHERETFEEVTRLRSQWGEAKTPNAKIAAAQGLEGALSRLMVVVESYPNLKANENFIRLQDELAGTENRIAVERKRYNETVRNYNVLVRRFPGNIVAKMFGFEKSTAYFEAEKTAEKAPVVNF